MNRLALAVSCCAFAGALRLAVPREPNSPEDFKCYAFDWDDNILNMPTKIHMERLGQPVALSTAEFALHRNDKELKPPGGNFDAAFREFRDDDPSRNKFLDDAVDALAKQAFGPAFGAWKRAVLEAAPWAVITARGHSTSTLRQGAKKVIREVLSASEFSALEQRISERYNHPVLFNSTMLDFYVNEFCDFYAVSGSDFQERMLARRAERLGEGSSGSLDLNPQKPEDGKKLALLHFTETQVGYNTPATMGFSDDDAKNVRTIASYMQSSLSSSFPRVKFVLYSTETGAQQKLASFLNGSTL